jgi:hypothetical protein
MESSRPPADPLQKLLDEAESELTRRLHEACEAEAQGVSTESTAEIRRLEDTLLAAAMAAERTIAARRHLREATQKVQAEPVETPPPSPAPMPVGRSEQVAKPSERADVGEPEETIVREFEDATGRRWRAWPVVPAARIGERVSTRSLGEYQEGWICFESLDNAGRRRLPGRKPLSELPASELAQLLERAINVPQRRSQPPAEPSG